MMKISANSIIRLNPIQLSHQEFPLHPDIIADGISNETNIHDSTLWNTIKQKYDGD